MEKCVTELALWCRRENSQFLKNVTELKASALLLSLNPVVFFREFNLFFVSCVVLSMMQTFFSP